MMGVLVLSVPFTALRQTLSAPPRWRGVFMTSLFTAIFCSSALLLFDTGQPRHLPHPLVCVAWGASVLQFVHRCFHYGAELADADRCSDREAFFSMCSLNVFGRKLPCTALNQGFMLLIASQLHTASGADLLVALALSDYLCVFQLFLARQSRFPTHLFLEGATLASSVPATAVFAAHGRSREAAVLCGSLAAWLAMARLWPASSP